MDEDYSSVSGTLSLSEPESPEPMSVSLPFISALPAVDMSVLNPCASTVSTEVESQVVGNPSGSKKKGRPSKSDKGKEVDLKVQQELKTSSKRGRGRPPGSRNNGQPSDLLNRLELWDLVPHFMTVYTGEDIPSKINSFKGSGQICIISAVGTVSSVTIRKEDSPGGIVTFEGCLQMLSLSGSMTVSNKDPMKASEGGLSVILAGPDGHLIGGIVAGLLTAASPFEVIVGVFKSKGNCSKAKKKKHQKNLNDIAAGGAIPEALDDPYAVIPATPISQLAPIDNNIFSTPTCSLSVDQKLAENHMD